MKVTGFTHPAFVYDQSKTSICRWLLIDALASLRRSLLCRQEIAIGLLSLELAPRSGSSCSLEFGAYFFMKGELPLPFSYTVSQPVSEAIRSKVYEQKRRMLQSDSAPLEPEARGLQKHQRGRYKTTPAAETLSFPDCPLRIATPCSIF